MNTKKTIFEHFNLVSDPRVERTKKHKLIDILVITVCGVLSDCDNWIDITDWAHENESWLRQYLELENGIPSHDTFGRVFALLKPDELQKAFRSWVEEYKSINRDIINIDGKFLNATKHFSNSRSALIMVSAWSVDAGITLGQLSSRLKKDEGEKRTTEKLLDCIEVKNNIITIDAMGATPAILNKIIDKEGDYVVCIKNNQKKIKSFIDKYRESNPKIIEKKTLKNSSHGREETREYSFISLKKGTTSGLNQLAKQCFDRFKKVGSFVRLESTRTVEGKTSTHIRYYMSSLDSFKEMRRSIRCHWSIENNLHWQMDVTFKEDQVKSKLGFIAENLSGIRRMAMNMLSNEKSQSISMRRKRRRCLMNKSYLAKVIFEVSV